MESSFNKYIPFISIFFVIAFFSFIYLMMNYRRKENLEILEHLCQRHHGTMKKSFMFNYPTLSFPHGSHEISVRLTPHSKHHPARTKVASLLNTGKVLKMTVCRKNIVLQSFESFGAQDIKIGNDEFDRQFRVKGDNESRVKDLLTPLIQQRLLALPRKGMSLTLNQSELKLVVDYIPSSEMDYDPILDSFMAVLDMVREGKY